MRFKQLGSSGLRVSALGLGTMMWGEDTDADTSLQLLTAFSEAGGNLLDTAASYGGGAAEEILGEAWNQGFRREDFVIVSKAGIGASEGARIDASRGNLLRNLEGSLRRLASDYLDVWLIQHPDPRTPIAETVQTLQLAQMQGKVRYFGVSNYPAWLFSQAATLAQVGAQVNPLAAPLSAAEVEFSLLQRGVEREFLPAAKSHGVGVLAWSALGRGVLTGKYRHLTPPDSRAASTHLAGFVAPYLHDSFSGAVAAVCTAAEGLGARCEEVALAWVCGHPQIASALIGPRTVNQLNAGLGGADLELPAPIRAALDEVTAPALGYPERGFA